MTYANVHTTVKFTSELVLPPRRLKPSLAAMQYLRNEKGAYDPAVSPMMEEPLDVLGSRDYTGLVFVGPARSSKTFSLLLGGLVYVQTCAPGDMAIIQMSTDSARDFSRGDLDRSIRHSPELRKKLSPRMRDDATYSKHWRNGTSLKVGWPAVSQLSSKTLQYIMFTDYDRPENRDNVDGEGPMWDLGYKRVTTYMSRGKCVAESSPGEVLTDPTWNPTTKHEAPPALGIMTLYNRGTRARWYWPCMHCGEYFQAEPGMSPFGVPDIGSKDGLRDVERMLRKKDPMSLAEAYATIVCKACGGIHTMEHRPTMNMRGLWVHDGQRIDSTGKRVIGERRRSNIASYWLGGVAATYQRWDSMLLNWFNGVQTYLKTGDESTLKSVTMTDAGAPYIPLTLAKARTSNALTERLEDWPKGMVPAGVRFITVSVDVQNNRFVVQAQGWGVGLESWLIDRYTVSTGKRVEDGDRPAALNPGAYQEDWEVLIDEVLLRKYQLQARPEIEVAPLLVLCDSGGAEGVTMRAYDFWRSLRPLGLSKLFKLVRGDGNANRPRVQETWPDNRNRKQRRSGARGDVPVQILNTNVLKDGISNDLARDEVGPGYVHLPKWVQEIEDDVLAELTVEIKGDDGWVVTRHGARNEAFDLHYYNRAACVMLRAENVDWANPPPWCLDPAQQVAVQQATVRGEERSGTLAELASRMNS